LKGEPQKDAGSTRVVLFGTGAMACLFGARLAAVADVTLVGTWREAIQAIRERGILLEDARGTQRVPVGARFYDDPPVKADLALVLVKAWQTGEVAAHLQEYLLPGSVAITLQNGLGNVELLGAQARAGSTGEGATLLGPGHVKSGGSGKTFAVAPDGVMDLFRRAGFEAYPSDAAEADSLLWGKLCINCGINALTALLRVKNGELLEMQSACDLMVQAAQECARVAVSKQIRLPYGDPAARVQEVARNTAGNVSSMYQDILRGTPTECDAIYGSVVRHAQLQGVDAPVNRILWTTMRALVQRNGVKVENESCA
jgi:2-dehydropantoate 2-reductase